jgi:Kinesin motor domain
MPPWAPEAAPRRADRGMIPRSISQLFRALTHRSEFTHAVHISYMEIYNSSAYDLLDPSREIKELADLPVVNIMEDDAGRFHMRNLSLHPCGAPLVPARCLGHSLTCCL